ncbi:MORC family CW-type zinc finger protein 3-like [Pelomyxa schiedti]|nr:MORC family CW-type zinc finger protein 3-like [Pelomyxa schiedti]
MITDNGRGMTPGEMHGLFQFGRPQTNDKIQIGRFGIGFKTGSMRISSDAIVFSLTPETASIGILSTSLNASSMAVTTPIVTFCRSTMAIDPKYQPDIEAKETLDKIFQVSPVKTNIGIGLIFGKIHSLSQGTNTHGGTGTCVMLFNLHKSLAEPTQLELMHVEDKHDIQVRPVKGKYLSNRRGIGDTKVPLDISLREYCSILYLMPSSIIYICGKKVETIPVHTSLSKVKRIKSTIADIGNLSLGYNSSDKERGLSGFHIYWHNRLCSSYYKVGSLDSKASYIERGNGLIGVVNANGLEPLNNKQGFNEDATFASLEEWLSKEVEKFLEEHEADYEQLPTDRKLLAPDNTWVQCNRCLKWRRHPQKNPVLPEQWFCFLNPDKQFNSCQKPQEDDSSDQTVGYLNTSLTSHNRKSPPSSPPSTSSTTTPQQQARPQKPSASVTYVTDNTTSTSTTSSRKRIPDREIAALFPLPLPQPCPTKKNKPAAPTTSSIISTPSPSSSSSLSPPQPSTSTIITRSTTAAAASAATAETQTSTSSTGAGIPAEVPTPGNNDDQDSDNGGGDTSRDRSSPSSSGDSSSSSSSSSEDSDEEAAPIKRSKIKRPASSTTKKKKNPTKPKRTRR